jgi:hypothetical protein
MRIKTARVYADMGRSTVYRHFWAGDFVFKKDGGRTLVSKESIDRYFDGLPEGKLRHPRPKD